MLWFKRTSKCICTAPFLEIRDEYGPLSILLLLSFLFLLCYVSIKQCGTITCTESVSQFSVCFTMAQRHSRHAIKKARSFHSLWHLMSNVIYLVKVCICGPATHSSSISNSNIINWPQKSSSFKICTRQYRTEQRSRATLYQGL